MKNENNEKITIEELTEYCRHNIALARGTPEEYMSLGGKYEFMVLKIAMAVLNGSPKTMRQSQSDSRTWIECGSDYPRGILFYRNPLAKVFNDHDN